LQCAGLEVTGHIAQRRYRAQLLNDLRNPVVQFVNIGILEAVLVLRPADAVFNRQLLHRLHVQRDSSYTCQIRLKTANDIAGVNSSLIKRLEIDLNASGVDGEIRSVDTDKG